MTKKSSKKQESKINWDKQPLGKVTDRELSEKLECSESLVYQQRKKRNIPALYPPGTRRPSQVEKGKPAKKKKAATKQTATKKTATKKAAPATKSKRPAASRNGHASLEETRAALKDLTIFVNERILKESVDEETWRAAFKPLQRAKKVLN